MKHIVVPVDFSENSLKAAQVAHALSKKINGRISLLHVYVPFQSGFQTKSANREEEIRAEAEAEDEMSAFMEKLDADSITGECRKGQLLEVLSDLHYEDRIDLVVMGTTGASGIRYHVIGSNTYDVALKSELPLLMVPFDITEYQIDRALFFTDFQADDKNTLEAFLHLFGEGGTQCKLVHLHEGDETTLAGRRENMDNWLAGLRSYTGFQALTGEVVEATANLESVEQIIEAEAANLLLLTLVERSFWEKLFDKSLAKEIILQSKIPVFIQP